MDEGMNGDLTAVFLAELGSRLPVDVVLGQARPGVRGVGWGCRCVSGPKVTRQPGAPQQAGFSVGSPGPAGSHPQLPR